MFFSQLLPVFWFLQWRSQSFPLSHKEADLRQFETSACVSAELYALGSVTQNVAVVWSNSKQWLLMGALRRYTLCRASSGSLFVCLKGWGAVSYTHLRAHETA